MTSIRRLCGDQLLEKRYVQVWIIAKSWKQSESDFRIGDTYRYVKSISY